MPHWIFRDYRSLCLFTATTSVALSVLAIYLDPVVNNDGVYYIRAAQGFAAGEWDEAFSVYKWPFYSFLIGIFIKISGLAPGHATYLVDSLLYVALVTGFVAFVRSIGGRGSVLWIAALVILFYPVINKFRPFVIRDIGYWACYLWSLAYFFSYVRSWKTHLLGIWAAFTFLAFLFRIEGLALLLMLPGWLLAVKASDRWGAIAGIAAATAVFLVLSAFTLWQYVSESGAAAGDLLSNPASHIVYSWGAAGAELMDRFNALGREFGGELSTWVSVPIYLATIVILIIVECAESLGVVYAGIVAYILVRKKTGFEQSVHYWWSVVIFLQTSLLIAFGFLNFFLADRYPVGLALTLLAPVPFFLDGLWRRWRARTRPVDWAPLVVGALLLISSIEGLNVSTQKMYLKEAGLWLREHGVPSKSMYSNNVILSYYAGSPEDTPRSEYSWERAMRLIWTGDWRQYDYLAVAIDHERSKHEKLILDKIGKQPLVEFSNSEGDKTLIFSPASRES